MSPASPPQLITFFSNHCRLKLPSRAQRSRDDISPTAVALGQGTNIYNLLMHSEYSEESIRGTLLEQWANGIKVLESLQSSNAWHQMCSLSVYKHQPATDHTSCVHARHSMRCHT